MIPDDLVSVFQRDTCSFGFASHLFGNEIKALAASSANLTMHNNEGGQSSAIRARGASFRISPTAPTELMLGEEPVSTLTQDFHTRYDSDPILSTVNLLLERQTRYLRWDCSETVTYKTYILSMICMYMYRKQHTFI